MKTKTAPADYMDPVIKAMVFEDVFAYYPEKFSGLDTEGVNIEYIGHMFPGFLSRDRTIAVAVDRMERLFDACCKELAALDELEAKNALQAVLSPKQVEASKLVGLPALSLLHESHRTVTHLKRLHTGLFRRLAVMRSETSLRAKAYKNDELYYPPYRFVKEHALFRTQLSKKGRNTLFSDMHGFFNVLSTGEMFQKSTGDFNELLRLTKNIDQISSLINCYYEWDNWVKMFGFYKLFAAAVDEVAPKA